MNLPPLGTPGSGAAGMLRDRGSMVDAHQPRLGELLSAESSRTTASRSSVRRLCANLGRKKARDLLDAAAGMCNTGERLEEGYMRYIIAEYDEPTSTVRYLAPDLINFVNEKERAIRLKDMHDAVRLSVRWPASCVLFEGA